RGAARAARRGARAPRAPRRRPAPGQHRDEMTVVLGFDTATPDTVVALAAGDAEPQELRHTPAPGERPGHAARLLPLARTLLDRAGLAFADLDRIGVGVGPGTF